MTKIALIAVFILFAGFFYLGAENLKISQVAIKDNDVEAVKQAIGQGADINEKIKYQRKFGMDDQSTPLIIAIEFSVYDVARLLIENGADVNVVVEGESALKMAVENKSLEMTKLLLDRGAEVNLPEPETMVFRTPLSIAAGNGSVEIAKLLIERGANVNSKSHPLFSAAYANSIEIAKLLIQHGANIDQKTLDGRTPLYMALERGSYEMVKLLIENGTDVNWESRAGDSLMKYAQRRGDTRIIQLLKQKGLKEDVRFARKMKFLRIYSIFGVRRIAGIILFILLLIMIFNKSVKLKINILGGLLLLAGIAFLMVVLLGLFAKQTPVRALQVCLYLGCIYIFLGFSILRRKKYAWWSTLIFTVIFTLILVVHGMMIINTDYSGFGGLMQVIFIYLPLTILNLFLIGSLSLSKKIKEEYKISIKSPLGFLEPKKQWQIILGLAVFIFGFMIIRFYQTRVFLKGLPGEIVYLHGDNGDIYKISANGLNKRLLFRNDDPANGRCFCPKWSEDGTKIYFTVMRNGELRKFEMDPEGHNVQVLPRGAEPDLYCGQGVRTQDGRFFIEESVRRFGENAIVISEIGKNNKVKVTVGESPDWKYPLKPINPS